MPDDRNRPHGFDVRCADGYIGDDWKRMPGFDASHAEWYTGDRHDLLFAFGQRAAGGLLEEDCVLRDRLTPVAGYDKDARGLTYPLCETALVYAVFKSIAALGRAEWDWQRERRYDLIFSPHAAEQWGFEAKWWSRADGKELDPDRRRLQEWCRAGPPKVLRRGFLMAFWWTDTRSYSVDLRNADKFFKRSGAPLVYRASFETRGPSGSKRRFFFDLIEAAPAA